ncbi:MAG: gamma-glutamyltransferase, partial [Phycisphaerae bacterium]
VPMAIGTGLIFHLHTPAPLRDTAQMATLSLTLIVSLFLADAPDSHLVTSKHGLVVSDSPVASEIGARILADGGNAFDATIATSLALTVARPQSTGIGGGGFFIAYRAEDQTFIVLDFRECAPEAATRDIYKQAHAAAADGPSPSVYGGKGVGTPGLLAGLSAIEKRLASRSFAKLAQPAIDLCEQGFPADQAYRNACLTIEQVYRKHPALTQRMNVLRETLFESGAPEVGTRIKRPLLAKTLRRLAAVGVDDFYHGQIARAIVAAVQADNGLLTMQDMISYRVRAREPVRLRYGEFEIVTMPPPSSGGICLAETLNILQVLPAYRNLPPHAPAKTHLFIEAMKHAFADRARWLGDADFAEVPMTRLMSESHAKACAAKISVDHAQDVNSYGFAGQRDDSGTSHLCVADRFGNVVVMTETINTEFGSLLVVPEWGIILNNEMDDFAANPGEPNYFGLIQGEANAVAPNKRPLSSMTPTIVLKDGKPVLALGASGGPRIITSVLQVMLNVLERDMPLDAAVIAPRIHHQWQPDEIYSDKPLPPPLVAALEALGHTFNAQRKIGVVQALQIKPDGTLIGMSDPRKGGRPAGVNADGKVVTSNAPQEDPEEIGSDG